MAKSKTRARKSFKKAKVSHHPKWYLYYSGASIIMALGFFLILYHYAHFPETQMTKQSIEDITLRTIDDKVVTDYQALDFDEEKNIPKIPILLFVLGIGGFLYVKYLYEREVRGKTKWLK